MSTRRPRPDFTDPRVTAHGFYSQPRSCWCSFTTRSRDEWWYHRIEECAGETPDEQLEAQAAFAQSRDALAYRSDVAAVASTS